MNNLVENEAINLYLYNLSISMTTFSLIYAFSIEGTNQIFLILTTLFSF